MGALLTHACNWHCTEGLVVVGGIVLKVAIQHIKPGDVMRAKGEGGEVRLINTVRQSQ